jgi:hypothetical protein
MLYEITVPQFTKVLKNLSACLEKGVAHAKLKGYEPEVLVNARLAPDQFALMRQVQIACDTAKLATSRLSGKDAPKHDDSEKTMAELQTRIQQTLDYLAGFKDADFQGAAERRITQPRWEGKWLTGHDFALNHALPNIYFHVTTAYAILRHNGVDVGKKDYLGEMPFRQP